MSSPLKVMFDTALDYVDQFQSDLMWDGVVIGKYANEEGNENQKYLWILRKSGTHLIPLNKKNELRGIFDFFEAEYKGGAEIKYFFIENPLDSCGRFFEISFDAAKMVMHTGTLEYPEPA